MTATMATTIQKNLAAPIFSQLRASQNPNGSPPPAPTPKMRSQISGPSNHPRRRQYGRKRARLL